MNKNEALHFCQVWLDSWSGNRPDELLKHYSEDAFYLDPARPNGIKGKEELKKYFTKLLQKYPSWTWKVVEVFPHENGVTLKWVPTLNPDSQPFYGLDIVELKNGEIIRNEVYFNPAVF